MRSSRLLAAGLLLCTTGVAVAQASASTPSPDSAAFFQEASDCSAAYKAGVTARLAQPKTEARDKAILEDTERSFVFIGVAYKQGLRKPEADTMLAQSEQRWAKLPKAEQAKRVGACTKRAEKLMEEVSFIERYAVQNRAKARVEQQFAKEQKQRAQ